jgi:phosphoglycerol transferase
MLDQAQVIQNQQRHYLRGAIRFLVYAIAFFLAAIAYWVNSNFGKASLEQVLYHAQFGMTGLVDTDVGIIISFVSWCIVMPVLTALVLVLLEYSIALYLIHGPRHWFAKPMNWLNLRGIKIFYWFIGHRAPLYLFILGFAYFAVQFSISGFIHNQFGKDYFGEHYVNPKSVQVRAAKTRNLVILYVESLENTYRDSKLFGRNLLTRLDNIEGSSFSEFRQVPGTHWTIAGITATHCGVPLKNVSLYGGNDQGEKVKSFLPNALCLGDILHQAGYYNVYMGGDALAFSGKGKFFQDHHYDEVLGKMELKAGMLSHEMNYWGLYDDDLLALAKAKLKTLHAAKQPFNLTITTIDTHGPFGYLSQYCRQKGIKDFKGIVECTAGQVADFVSFIKTSGYLEDTNVVVLGDHLAMWNPLHDKIDSVKERFIYNKFISKQPISKNREAILHFDMLPTILEFAGFEVGKGHKGGRLGLGYSGIAKGIELPSATAFEEMNEDLLNQSDAYLDLWREDSTPD